MKKLYSVAAIAALALSANAQIYILGSGVGLDWTPETPMEVALTDGNYTFAVENLNQFKVSTTKGTSWDDYNVGALTCELTEENLGTPVELVAGDANIGTPWVGNYTITVSGDLKTLTATTTTPKPEGFTKIYLRGGMNEWGAPEDWMFTTEDGVTYYFDCTAPHNIAMGTSFKIADADWGNVNYGAGGEVIADEFPVMWNYNAIDAIMAEDYDGQINLVLPAKAKDPAEVTFFPKGAGVGNVSIENNAAKEYFNLQGVRVETPAAGLYIVRQGDKVYKEIVK